MIRAAEEYSSPAAFFYGRFNWSGEESGYSSE